MLIEFAFRGAKAEEVVFVETKNDAAVAGAGNRVPQSFYTCRTSPLSCCKEKRSNPANTEYFVPDTFCPEPEW
jgi:hypothetical protein